MNPSRLHATISRIAGFLAAVAVFAAGAVVLEPSAQAGELYVGTNYHPHDSDPAQWTHDIRLMQAAGFRVVRMGHLAWDSYEPADGQFNFAWFDQVMDEMQRAGIKVILDLAVRPAPLWLHSEHPSVNISDVDGVPQYPNHRYMEDVGDPVYQQYALRYAHALIQRYAHHPALLGFGLDNESGDGPISYSPAVRERFIAWLQAKYSTLEALNAAWASQRWSRRVGAFSEIGLPRSNGVDGPPERLLDFQRFISDEMVGFLRRLCAQVRTDAPGALISGNWWYYTRTKYFDYAALAYAGAVDRGGCGFYPGDSLRRSDGLVDAMFGIARIRYERPDPFWCTEFVQASAAPGAMRRAAYASLFLGTQALCAWTWQSMHGGEEQFLQGLTGWDGEPRRAYGEYRQIAEEFRKIQAYGFPYQPRPAVALALSFPSQEGSLAFPEPHDSQTRTAFAHFLRRNIDTEIVDIPRSALQPRLLVLAGLAIMDQVTANRIREYVRGGGTVVMTSYSAMLDEHHQVFHTALPGMLSDVFGIRVTGFEQTEIMNELSPLGFTGGKMRACYRGRTADFEAPRFDVVKPEGAEILGRAIGLDQDYPLVTSNRFGAGTAIYVAVPAREELLGPVLDECSVRLDLPHGPDAPDGVLARRTDAHHALYLNLLGATARIPLPGSARSLITGRQYSEEMPLPPFAPDFIEFP